MVAAASESPQYHSKSGLRPRYEQRSRPGPPAERHVGAAWYIAKADNLPVFSMNAACNSWIERLAKGAPPLPTETGRPGSWKIGK